MTDTKDEIMQSYQDALDEIQENIGKEHKELILIERKRLEAEKKRLKATEEIIHILKTKSTYIKVK